MVSILIGTAKWMRHKGNTVDKMDSWGKLMMK